MTRGQCCFQGELSDLGIPLAPRGGETFFIQHCRGQTGGPLLRSSPQEGTRVGAVSLPGILGLGFAWVAGGVWISLVPTSLSQREGSSPRAGSCLYIAQKLVWVL